MKKKILRTLMLWSCDMMKLFMIVGTLGACLYCLNAIMTPEPAMSHSTRIKQPTFVAPVVHHGRIRLASLE